MQTAGTAAAAAATAAAAAAESYYGPTCSLRGGKPSDSPPRGCARTKGLAAKTTGFDFNQVLLA